MSVASQFIMEINNNKDNDVLAAVFGIICSLLIALILGSYVYTWNESERTMQENHKWREEHLRSLDKQFDGIRSEQKAIVSAIEKSSKETNDMLHKLLEEQRVSQANRRYR